MKRALLLFTASIALVAADPAPVPLRVFSAGSMTGALGAMLKRYTAETGQTVELVTGPAGVLRERIERGDPADLFVSANMAHPRKLAAEGKARNPVVFAHNRLCMTARHDVGLTRTNMLDTLLNPNVRIGTSTPGADPGGDYAWALFEKAGTIRRGATAILKAKAKPLVGGRSDPPIPAGQSATRYLLDQRIVDVFVGYCSARNTTPDPGVDKIEVPTDLAIPADYGMAVLKTSHDTTRIRATTKLARWLVRPAVQAIMVPYGFIPR